MRVWVVVFGAAALIAAAGCGSSGKPAQPPAGGGTLGALLARPGEDVALIEGDEDFQPGPSRFSFVILRDDGRPIQRPRARVWIARGLDAKPFAQATATLEDIGVPGSPYSADFDRIYVARFSIPRPGKLWVLAEPVGGTPIQGIGNLIVSRRSASPQIGAKAIRSQTPTLQSTHGDVARLTTRQPPDRALVRYSVAGSLTEHKPFVLVFATPKFCTSRTCGPVVDVVDRVRRRIARRGVRFIHVEVYENNRPPRYNRWMREWGLRTEPWVFLVGADGRIKAKFEGSVSIRELSAAVRQTLLS